MNQKNLISLIILDIIVIFFALGLIFLRYRSLTAYTDYSLADLSRSIQQKQTAKTQEKKSPDAAAVPELQKKPADSQGESMKTRNIGFSFRNSKAKKVAIIGSFNNWVPQPLIKGENHTWKISLALTPGEYTYNFVVDGRPLRDPFNAKISNAGRGFASSYLKVNPVK